MQGTSGNDDVIEIDLQELFGLLVHWLWLIVGCGIITGIAGFLISFFLITPMYRSTTKVYILDRDTSNGNLTYSDVQLGSVLTKDYTQLIKDRTVLEEVLATFGLNESYASLASRVEVEALSDTRIITITVEDENPEVAQVLADEIRRVAADHIKDVTAIEAVNVVEEANLPTGPSSPSVFKWTGIGALLGIFLCAMFVVIRFLMDDTIKTSEDVEKYLELSTLAMIPIIEDEAAKNKKNKKTPASGSSSSGSGGGSGRGGNGSRSTESSRGGNSGHNSHDMDNDDDPDDLEEVF